MKKLGLICICVLGMQAANAQKGTALLFGDLNFHFLEQPHRDTLRVQRGNIHAGIGIQVSDHLTIGIAGGYGIVSTRPDSATTKRYNHSLWSAGAFVRYSTDLSSIFQFYTQLDGGYHFENDKYDSQPQPGTKYTGFTIGLTPGIAVNVKNGFKINFGFGGLSYDNTKADGASGSVSTIDFTFGRQFDIGFSKNLGYNKVMARGQHQLKKEEE